MTELIASYHYCNSDDRKKLDNIYYRKSNTLEKEKTNLLKEKMLEFERKVRGYNDLIVSPCAPEANIIYRDNLGYISCINADRDIIDIYYYGKDEYEAFYNAIIDYEFSVSMEKEFNNRKKLKRKFERRFPTDEYRGVFYFAELSLKDFKKFYKGNIPIEVTEYFDKYITNIVGECYKYDITKNRIIKEETPSKRRIRKI